MKPIPHPFNQFELEPEEELQGQLLNTNQEAVLQNLLARNSTDKLALAFDPQNPLGFAQQEAYLRGQIDLLRYLLDCNSLAKTILKGN